MCNNVDVGIEEEAPCCGDKEIVMCGDASDIATMEKVPGFEPCSGDSCKVPVDGQEAKALDEQVRDTIECKLVAFDHAIAVHDSLEIDGVTKEDKIKVINHYDEQAYEVDVDTIIQTPLAPLVFALETGITQKLSGITRIVGYYSRIENWNKSKIGELQDRHKGQYSVGKEKLKNEYFPDY